MFLISSDRVVRNKGHPGELGEVVSVIIRVKFPHGLRSFRPEDLTAVLAPKARGYSKWQAEGFDVAHERIHSSNIDDSALDIYIYIYIFVFSY